MVDELEKVIEEYMNWLYPQPVEVLDIKDFRDYFEGFLVGKFMNQINLYHQQGIHYFKGRIRYYNKDDLNIIRNLMNNLKLRFKVKYRSTPNFVNVEIWLD